MKKFDLSSMRFIASGAAPLSAELTNQLAKLFPAVQIGQGFGGFIVHYCLPVFSWFS